MPFTHTYTHTRTHIHIKNTNGVPVSYRYRCCISTCLVCALIQMAIYEPHKWGTSYTCSHGTSVAVRLVWRSLDYYQLVTWHSATKHDIVLPTDQGVVADTAVLPCLRRWFGHITSSEPANPKSACNRSG